VVAAFVVATLVFVGFISLMTFYKGDNAWGPRYLTPVYDGFWLYAPDGVRAVGRRWAAGLLAAGAVVQVLALSVDPQRLYLERRVPTGFYLVDPWLHFKWELSHLINRPREVYEVMTSPPAPEFNQAEVPTYAPILDIPEKPDEVTVYLHRYQVFHGARFWWASFPHLAADKRPIDLAEAGLAFGAVAAAGLGLLSAGLRGRVKE
jgi:hypothetical protein